MELKNSCFKLLIALIGVALQAQSFTPSYVEALYQVSLEEGGTARYRALSGAMGALGADVSASTLNPASTAIYKPGSGELSASLGVFGNRAQILNNGQLYGERQNELQFAIPQIGIAYNFETYASDWKSVGFTLNSQRSSNEYTLFNIPAIPSYVLTPVVGLPNSYFGGHSQSVKQRSVNTHLGISGNYDHKLYLGAGFNFKSYKYEVSNVLTEVITSNGDERYYQKQGSPYTDEGIGFKLNLGAINRFNQNLRMGAFYHSPTWWNTESFFTEYDYNTTNGENSTYSGIYEYESTSFHQMGLSAAYLFDGKGLVSVEWHYLDPTTMRLGSEFREENRYMKNEMQGVSQYKIGTEWILNDIFTVRAGYRSQPNSIFNSRFYQPYGCFWGASFGLAANFSSGFFLEGSYEHLRQNRESIFQGEYYYPQQDAVSNFDFGSNNRLDRYEARFNTVFLTVGYTFK